MTNSTDHNYTEDERKMCIKLINIMKIIFTYPELGQGRRHGIVPGLGQMHRSAKMSRGEIESSTLKSECYDLK